MWKYAAYAGGPVVLDAVIAVTTGRPLPPAPRPDRAYAAARLRAAVKLWVASVLDATGAGLARQVAAGERLRRIDSAAAGEPAARPEPHTLLGRFLAASGPRPPGRAKTPAPTPGPAADDHASGRGDVPDGTPAER